MLLSEAKQILKKNGFKLSKSEAELKKMANYLASELTLHGVKIDKVFVNKYATISCEDYGELDGEEYKELYFTIAFNDDGTIFVTRRMDNQVRSRDFNNIQEAIDFFLE